MIVLAVMAIALMCWRNEDIVFAESKWKGHDAIPLSVQWLEAALDLGHPLDSFLVVEWSIGS